MFRRWLVRLCCFESRKIAFLRALALWSKPEVAERAGLSLTHLAIAFAKEHPAVSSVIIGPRTPEQLEDLLAAADLRLDAETLDAIDALVPPGSNVNPLETGMVRLAGMSSRRRRRA